MPYEEEDTCQQKMNCTCVTQRHTHVCGLCLCVRAQMYSTRNTARSAQWECQRP